MNMKRQFALGTWIVAFFATLVASSSVNAAPMLFSGTSSDGHAVTAIVNFVLNDVTDTVSVTFQNTTSLTLDSGELITGLDFSIGGLTPTLTSDAGIQRTVDGAGVYVDTALPQDLSWSVASLGSGDYQLNFNPNAKDAIIGPPTTGSYASANGSIKGNVGHNPFAAELAQFQLSVPGLLPSSTVQLLTFRFGTTLAPATGTVTPLPEPSAGGLLAAACGFFAFFGRCMPAHAKSSRAT
jgi:hypothetical protein